MPLCLTGLYIYCIPSNELILYSEIIIVIFSGAAIIVFTKITFQVMVRTIVVRGIAAGAVVVVVVGVDVSIR